MDAWNTPVSRAMTVATKPSRKKCRAQVLPLAHMESTRSYASTPLQEPAVRRTNAVDTLPTSCRLRVMKTVVRFQLPLNFNLCV